MKRLLWIFVCLVTGMTVTSSAAAQEVSAGIRIGVTSATVSVEGLTGFEPEARTGVQGGVWLTLGGRTVRLQPELIVSTRKFLGGTPAGDVSVKSTVIEVPVLLAARGNADGKVHPLLLVGPSLSFIRNPTQTFGGVETNIDDQLKGTDAGLVIGGGLEVDVTRGALVFDVRYVFGLKNIATAADTTFKTRAWLASVGYRF